MGDDGKLKKMAVSPFFKDDNFLEMENGEAGAIEIITKPKKVEDDKPVLMAAAILSNSKLHFLKFIYEVVYKYFIPGSFKLAYCDTDSIAIGKLFLDHLLVSRQTRNSILTLLLSLQYELFPIFYDNFLIFYY